LKFYFIFVRLIFSGYSSGKIFKTLIIKIMRFVVGKFFVLIITVSLLGTSCKYQKLLKSNDNELKYTKAKEYYEKRDFAKAMELFEQIIPIFRGTDRGEEINYLFSYCNYYLRDYVMAGHYFRRFASQFPNSEYTMEASFMSAYCYYLDAPKHSLEQETTRKALTEFELYIIRYPTSDKIPECNKLMDELRYRLETKSYENAMLYYKLGQYKSAIIALKSSVREFPDSKYREDLHFHIAKASYLYAVNSIYTKTTERLNEAAKENRTFLRLFPEGKYSKEVQRMSEDISKRLKNVS
jgi:outer membrane protein assembly factor BamD